MFSITRRKEDVLKARIVHIPTTPSTSTNWTTRKARAKAAAKRQGLLHQRGTGPAMHGEKESARKGTNANTNTLNQQTPKHPLQRLTPSKAKAQAKPKAAAPAIVRKVHIAMPAITVKRAATSEAKKGDRHAEESEAEVETVYHDRDAEDAMSESSRWSGETEIPEKYVWFQKILDNDVSEEVEYLKNEDEQWRKNSMWYKGFYEDMSQTSSKPVDAKTFKTYDHRRHLAYSHKKALIRAEIMSEAAHIC